MPDPTAAEIRARAEQARRLSNEIFNRQAQAELLQIAEALEAAAAKLIDELTGEDQPTRRT